MPADADYKVWFETKYPGVPPSGAVEVQGSSLDIDAPEVGYLAVYQPKSGNTAVRPVSGLKNTLVLKTSDFKDAAEVQIRVTYDNKPVEAASLDLKDSRRTQTAILDSSRKGQVSFYGVAQGPDQLTVRYVSGGKDAEPLKLITEVKADRAEPVAVFTVALPSEAATVSPASGATPLNAPGQSPPPKEKLTTGGVVFKTVTMLVGIVFVGGLIWLVYYLFKTHPDALGQKLAALGVQIPKDPNQAMDAGPVQPAAPIAPKPVQKIILEDSDPTPLGATPATAVVSSGPVSPKLVGEAGGQIDLTEGAVEIGREMAAGLGVADPSTLSRRHAEIVRRGDEIKVRDLGSTNGTFVNGQKIESETMLHRGDQVQFGAVRFRMEA